MPDVYKSNQELNGSVYNYSEKINSVIEKHSLPSDILSKFDYDILFDCRKQFKYNSNEVELYYIEHSYTMFLTPGGNLAMLRQNNKGKWYFFPYYSYFTAWQKISYHIREEEIKKAGLKEPNYIGVFTEKKVSEWLKYCDDYLQLIDSVIEAKNDKNTDIEKAISDFIEKSCGKVSSWGNEERTTEVQLPLFRVLFKHFKSSQYLSTEISFKGTLNDILTISNK
jgi:hypothetical protein